jgi:hypothetical protein
MNNCLDLKLVFTKMKYTLWEMCSNKKWSFWGILYLQNWYITNEISRSAYRWKKAETESLGAYWWEVREKFCWYGKNLSIARRTHLFVKLHALANATKSPNWWKGLVQSTYTLQHPHSRVTGEEKVNTWTQIGEEKVNMWTQRGATAIFIINCENQDSNSRPWALIPC